MPKTSRSDIILVQIRQARNIKYDTKSFIVISSAYIPQLSLFITIL